MGILLGCTALAALIGWHRHNACRRRLRRRIAEIDRFMEWGEFEKE